MRRQDAQQWDAGYPRVSTDLQVERDALQNQVQALEGYAAAHSLNLRLYPEEGVSAKDTDRPKLQELLADVRAKRVRSVVVTKLDRISRSLADLLDLMKLFEEHGVKFVSLRDNIDTSGPVGRFMLHILGAIAELERGITAERVAEDMKLRAKRGKWNGGLSPYGRRVEDGQLRIVPEEAEVLHRMRKLLLEIRTWRGVAVALNRSGLRTRGWEPVDFSQEDPVAAVRRATGGRGAHAVIECAGTGQTLAQAVEMTRKGGHVAAIGIPLEPAALPVTKLVLDEIDLHGVRANRGTCEEVLPLMVRGAVDVRKLLTHRFPLSRFPEALDTFVKRKDGALKVLVEP